MTDRKHTTPDDPRPCNGCGAPIFWVRTRRLAWMPLDAKKPALVTLENDASSPDRKAVPLQGHGLYVPHHTTCPKADDFRRIRRKGNRPDTEKPNDS